VAKPDVAHKTVAFDRAWWGARVPDAAATALVTPRNRAEKVKRGVFGKRQFY
jgi:hypothetical protein